MMDGEYYSKEFKRNAEYDNNEQKIDTSSM